MREPRAPYWRARGCGADDGHGVAAVVWWCGGRGVAAVVCQGDIDTGPILAEVAIGDEPSSPDLRRCRGEARASPFSRCVGDSA